MILEILKYPDERLKQVSKTVTEFNEQLHLFLNSMKETMYAARGLGLAAPQVNDFRRIFIIDPNAGTEEPANLMEFINPKLHDGNGWTLYEEGCLSVPEFYESVRRREKIQVDYQDRFGVAHTLHAEGLLAIALQHENDHLDGILFVDRLSLLKKRFAKKELKNRAL